MLPWQKVAVWFGALLFAIPLAGCPRYGVIDDGTSLSFGPSNHGMLIRPARLPSRGTGYEIPSKWRRRGLNFGTDEIVALVVHTGRQIARELPGSRLQIADISRRRGGPSAWHRSHQTGRDVDILFFSHNARGKDVRFADMVHFRGDGTMQPLSAQPTGALGPGSNLAVAPGEGQGSEPAVFFDVERNWVLVRTLIENPIADIQYIFVYEPLRQMLLDHAQKAGERSDVIAQAAFLLRQPSDSAPHDDHFHIRIYCAPTDRIAGCHDRGALRWTKKLHKYGRDRPGARLASAVVPAGLERALLAPMPAMMVLGFFSHMP